MVQRMKYNTTVNIFKKRDMRVLQFKQYGFFRNYLQSLKYLHFTGLNYYTFSLRNPESVRCPHLDYQ